MSKTAETQVNTAAELAGARAAMYGFLSQLLLAPPAEAALAKLGDRGFVADLAVSLGLPPSSAESELLSSGALNSPDSLVQEYHDLFLVPLGRYVAPYESVHRGVHEIDGWRVDGLLQSEYTVMVQAKYRDAGAEITEGFLDLPDHIGLELAFMQFLCQAEQEARQQNDAAERARLMRIERSFLKDHLGEWAPALCRRIQERAEGPFYKGVARLVEAFISMELSEMA